jgi:hypothetical protein
MAEISVVEAFGELLALFNLNHESVEFRRLIDEFVDNGSVLGTIKADDGPACGGSAPHGAVRSQPSDALIRCLATARALNAKS